MVGVGVPTLLIAVCWLGSLWLSGGFLVEVLVAGGIARATATAVAVAVEAVFAAAVWARTVAPDVARRVVELVITGIAGVWLLAGLAADAPPLVALLAAAWSVVGTWAGVRLAVDRRGSTQHALYRFFDAHGRLLYVGRTGQPPHRRFGQHAAEKWWYGQVATRTIAYFPTRSALAEAEREAIRRERPKYNRVRYRGAA